MFRIRKVYDTFLPINKKAIEKIQIIAQEQIADLSEESIRAIPNLIVNPLLDQMQYVLFIADDSRGEVKGFALMSYDPANRFCFLDILAADINRSGGGIGGALYERLREEAVSLRCTGLYFDCKSDAKYEHADESKRKMNASRLRFYEQYGARPIENIEYESISRDHYPNAYVLMYDSLGSANSPDAKMARKIIRLILERKYKGVYAPDEVSKIVESIIDDPLRLRPFRYRRPINDTIGLVIPEDKKIALIYSDKHHIHHIKERGYAESPVRIETILSSILATGLFKQIGVKNFPRHVITEVHSKDFYDYLKMVSETFEPGKSLYPDVFPIRKEVKKPAKLSSHVGYYCIDIYSPINRNAFIAARNAVDCALTGAVSLLYGTRLAYALIRPPGHHAGKGYAGGFCYLNSTAISANFLSKFGKVATLDIDYHHGNGQQEIFYERSDVLTVSMHASPEFEYPYFSGYGDETGVGAGAGYNLNFPLKRGITGIEYMKYLRRALAYVKRFNPQFLVLAFGLDTAKGDPTGTWLLTADDFENIGSTIGSIGIPMLVVQEGGYDNRHLGKNAQRFFVGLWNRIYR